MRLPFWIRYFNVAFNFFTSFGYFDTRREHDNAMRTMSQSLTGKGYLVIDYLNARYCENHLQHKMEKEQDGVLFHITKWMDETHFYKKIEIEDERLDRPLEFPREDRLVFPGRPERHAGLPEPAGQRRIRGLSNWGPIVCTLNHRG